ncbi:MAG TPA: DmsC/YnfH family molybdoenzyme membrane anchor subunit [Anaerolineales bacterium]|nr:DmsC/YnfH family molybdoenzyme membrane anchor subunit [Anaerolineales bacterium]
MTYAFSFDARFCSGCKACQAACKDKNNLPVGVLWRRVVEVSGGSWQQNGDAWCNSVFAYNFSLSCNHCVYPKCAGVCPTNAYEIRDDGIVFLDTTKCMGCGYCAWACPYGAPQYNPEVGHMTKCDFCLDQLEQGLPPACVAACPLRVLDYGDIGTEQGVTLWNTPAETHPYPLPTYSHTQPRLAIKPHAAMSRRAKKVVANLEEIQPCVPSRWEDVPLILFTLLTQMAVGGFWAISWTFPFLWSLVEYDAMWLKLLPYAFVGISLGAGMFASLTHLGTKKNAWRALAHLRKSSLSREVLFTVLFGLGWLFTTLESMIWRRITFEAMALTAILGLGLIHNMSQVYRFPAAPKWNTWRTNVGFMVSALLLGESGMSMLLTYESRIIGIHVAPVQRIIICSSMVILLLAQLALIRKPASQDSFQNIRIGLLFFGMVLTIISFLLFSSANTWISSLIFLFVVTEEGLGRWLFYRARV